MKFDKLVNAEAERNVIATILFHADGIELFQELAPRDIASTEMRMVFQAMAQEAGEGRRPTVFTVASYLPDEAFTDRTPVQFMAGLSRFADPSTARDNLDAIKHLATRRALIDTGEILCGEAWNADFAPEDLAAQAMQHLDAIISSARRQPSRSLMFEQAKDALLAMLDSGDRSHFIDSGLDTLNRMLGGLPRGEMTLLAGRPSMGKSALLFAIARQAATRGVTVLIFSLEMQLDAVMARMVSDVCWGINGLDSVPYETILRRNVSNQQRQRMASMLSDVQKYAIRVDDTPGLTAVEIQMRARKFATELDKQGKRLDLVIVDHLGKVRASDRYAGNMVHETGEKSNAFMHMSKDLGVAGLIAQQLNRGPEGRDEKRPGMADLRDSGNLEQDAHTILFPFRQAYYLERQKFDNAEAEAMRKNALKASVNVMEVGIAKNRNGPCGTVRLYADMGSNAIRDLLSERHAAAAEQGAYDGFAGESAAGGDAGAC